MTVIIERSKNKWFDFWFSNESWRDCGDLIICFFGIQFSFYKKDNPWRVTVTRKIGIEL